MKDAKTIIMSCFSAKQRDEDRQTTAEELEDCSRPRNSPRKKSLESMQGPGVEESQCIIMILQRPHGPSKEWVVLVKHMAEQHTKKKHAHTHGFLFNTVPSGYSPSSFGPSDFWLCLCDLACSAHAR